MECRVSMLMITVVRTPSDAEPPSIRVPLYLAKLLAAELERMDMYATTSRVVLPGPHRDWPAHQPLDPREGHSA